MAEAMQGSAALCGDKGTGGEGNEGTIFFLEPKKESKKAAW